MANGQGLQKPVSGKIDRIKDFPSLLTEPRNIDIWLPEGYDGKRKFAVLYMHDGQMLFDSTTTWNNQSWDVDDVAARLMKEGLVMDIIVVGVWNSGSGRHANYFPQKPFDNLSKADKSLVISELQKTATTTIVFQPNSDKYLEFLVTELKPFIDKNYNVYTGANRTFIAGSSMGGLISMYAICEYPEIFGGAACISTHWPGTFAIENNPVPEAFLRYMKEKLPEPNSHKIYFDCGDKTIDAMYPPIQKKVDEVMRSKGYSAKNWITKYFEGKDHSERAWNERLHIPLKFLLGKDQ